MEQVNPGIKRKNRFVIVDAVGVCDRDLTDSRPLEKERTVTFDKLLDAVALGNREPEVIESLAGRLVRLEKRFDEALAAEVRASAKGQTLCEIAQTLLEAVNPDKVEEAGRPLILEQQRRDAAATLNYFDPNEPVGFLTGDLPHWRQDGATYFVTFRLADSLPQVELDDHYVCQSVALLRPVLDTCARFAELYLASQENGQAQWKRYIYGQGRPHLSFEQLRMTAILLPPSVEQQRIVAEVSVA